MPQEIRILKCYKCNTFQTDIVKKAKKWTCKICGAKQSVMQEYGRGSGMDCRLKVQKLNNDEILERQIITNTLDNCNSFDNFSHKEMTIIENIEKKENKWLHYAETPQKDEEESNGENNMFVNTKGNRLVTNKPLKRLNNDEANSKLESNKNKALTKGSLLNFSLNKNDKEKSNELVSGIQNIKKTETSLCKTLKNNLFRDKIDKIQNKNETIEFMSSKWSQFVEKD